MLTRKETFFDRKLILDVPEDFVELNDEEINEFYKEERPNIVYGNKDRGAILSISWLEQFILDEDIERKIQEYAVLYKCSIPKFGNCKIAKREINENKCVGIFHYTSSIEERDFFNYIVLGCMDDRELLITMHCNLKDCLIYAEKFMKTINSIDFDI